MLVRFLASAAFFVSCTLCADERGVSINEVRELGAQIAHAQQRFDHGTAPTATEMSNFDREVMRVNASGTDSGLDPAIHHKVVAVTSRFQKLKFDIRQPPSTAQSRPVTPRMDNEMISATHGAACAHALGISENHPVRLVMSSGSSAWFFVAASDASNRRFWTRSSGPDPVLEVFDSCKSGAMAIASNDDSFGLDADVGFAALSAQMLYVRVSNAGESGPVVLATAAAPGSINGTVKDGKTGLSIANAEVALYATSGGFAGYGYAYTAQNGAYSVTPGQPGTYYVVANAQSYVTQLYPSGYCPNGIYYFSSDCDVSHAHAVTVTATGSVSNINFAMSMGQKIFGQVRATDNSPIATATVQLLQPNGQGLGGAVTDAAGHYSFSTLGPGSYVVEATANGYGSQLFDHVACAGPVQTQCNLLAANPVTIASQDLIDINFSLPRLSTITGHIVGNDGHPLLNVQTSVFDANGNFVAAGSTDMYGNYTAGPIGNGTFYILASSDHLFTQVYPGIDCTSCGPNTSGATPFTFTAAGQTARADFVMDYLPTLTGRITDASSGLPVSGVQILVDTQPPAVTGYSNYAATTDASGYYAIANIPIGSYFVWAQSSDHVDQVYSGVVCESISYFGPADCNVSGATLLTVSAGEQTLAPFDFALDASGSISGRTQIRAGTGSDLAAMVTTTIYDGTGSDIGYAASDINGNYTVTDLAPGTYYAVASSPYVGVYISQIWQNIDCSPCVPTSGTPVVVPNATLVSDIDFHLIRLDAVVGRVVDDKGSPISGVVVDMFALGTNSYVSGAGSDANGFYMVSAPVNASYYLATEAGGGYTDQVYSGISCPSGTVYDHKCSLSGATPVNLSVNATQPHIANFVLLPNDRVFENGFD
jgi:hypothetical protein